MLFARFFRGERGSLTLSVMKSPEHPLQYSSPEGMIVHNLKSSLKGSLVATVQCLSRKVRESPF
jgi:hypothetical protein